MWIWNWRARPSTSPAGSGVDKVNFVRYPIDSRLELDYGIVIATVPRFTVVVPDAPWTETCTLTGVPLPPVPVVLPAPLQDASPRASTTTRVIAALSTIRMRILSRERLRCRTKIRISATNSAITWKVAKGKGNFGRRRGNSGVTAAGLVVTLTFSDAVAVALAFI